MTELPVTSVVPEWTLGDRMRKAREHAGLKQAELAEQIGVGRTSVVNYESDSTEPSRPVLLSWALRCGVSFEWLTGMDPTRWGGAKAQVSAGFRNKRTTTFRNTLAALPAVDHSRFSAVSHPLLRVRSGR